MKTEFSSILRGSCNIFARHVTLRVLQGPVGSCSVFSNQRIGFWGPVGSCSSNQRIGQRGSCRSNQRIGQRGSCRSNQRIGFWGPVGSCWSNQRNVGVNQQPRLEQETQG